jgi:hypothetical protein
MPKINEKISYKDLFSLLEEAERKLAFHSEHIKDLNEQVEISNSKFKQMI